MVFEAKFPPATAALCLAAALGALAPQPAFGQEFCSEPVMPYCVDQYSDFDSTLQMNRCEEDLKEQQRKLEQYRECTAEKIEDLQEELNDALKELEEVRKSFSSG